MGCRRPCFGRKWPNGALTGLKVQGECLLFLLLVVVVGWWPHGTFSEWPFIVVIGLVALYF